LGSFARIERKLQDKNLAEINNEEVKKKRAKA
jgi:hypothetical protein